MAQLIIDIPAGLITTMQTEAADRGVTVDDLVREAFRNVRGRIDQATLEAGGSVIA